MFRLQCPKNRNYDGCVSKAINIYLVIVTRCTDGYNPHEKVKPSKKKYVISYITCEKVLTLI